MSNYNSLKTTIDANIKQNGRQEITGQILNSVLNQMVTTLGAGYQFAGVATLDPATDPGTPDAKVFYIANGKGTYTNFGGLEVTEDDVVVLYWDSSWHKESTGIASQAKLSELDQEVNFGNVDIINNYYIDPQGKIGLSSIGFYTSPIQVRAGDVITYSIKGVDCAILSSYANNTYTPIVVAGNTEETFVDREYNVVSDGFIVFSGAKGTLKVSTSRSRIDHLSDDVDELEDDVEKVRAEVFGNVDIINNYYIDPQGKIGLSSIGFYTEPIFLKQGETITYSIKGVDCAILSTYSLGKYTPVVIAPSDYTETYTDKTYIAATDGFIVFSGEQGSLKLQKTSSIIENAERIEHLEDVVNIKPYVVNNGKYITPEGIIETSNNGFYTEPIFLKQGEIIKFSINGWACSILSLYNNGGYTPLLISNIGEEESLNNIQYIAPQDEYVVFSGTPNTLILTSSVSVLNDRISALENKENSISAVSYGSVKNDGTIDSSVRTSLLIRIEGGKGFYIKLNPGFRFIAAHLYDDNSNERLQSYFCGGTNSWIPLKYDNYSSFGQDIVITGQHLLVVVTKSDNSTISNDEFKNVIKTFCYLNDSRLHRWVLEDNWFLFAHKRMRCLSNTQWKALEYVKPITSTFSSYRFLKGENYIGVPYSDTSEKMKYVGMQVSPYTFVTATMNKRSVVYTEDINPTSPHSEYGIVYDVAGQSACHCFYGSVCSGFTAAIMGLPLVYLVSSYNEGAPYPVPNLTTIVNANANNVRPLDLIYYQGHISIISDIYKDDYGRVKYILWAEYNYPNVWINVYTSEVFEERLSDNNAVVRRYSDWGNTCTDINIPDCVPAEFNDYARTLDIEKDLHVFTGDKSSFSLDDPIYLNINRTPGYNTLLVYKDNAKNPTFTIDISGIESDNIYPEDTDDWCIYNMRLQTLTYGKYKARLSDGNGNYSGYVYFEIVDSGASLNIENGVITSIEFTASNATPIAVVTCDQDYYQKAVKIPTSSEIENKVIALNWSKSSAKYINLLLRGDYGVVYKRFKLN